MKLLAVHHKATGHVVGAVSGTGLPEAPAVTDLVGQAGLVLHHRTGDQTAVDLPLPVDDLDVMTVEPPVEELTAPLAYRVDGAGKKLVQLGPWTVAPSTPVVTLSTSAATVSLPDDATTDPQVVLPGNAPTDPQVVLVLARGTDVVLQQTQQAENTSDKVQFPVQLDPGTYGALVLVAGFYGLLDVCTLA